MMKTRAPNRKRPAEERFWEKVARTNDPDSCWLWTGTRTAGGYGKLHMTGKSPTYAHRFSYQLAKGPIPDGLELDHLCRTPSCVRPSHLEAVTPWENNRRGMSATAINARATHCPQGHPYDETNTTRDRHGHRKCRACNIAHKRADYTSNHDARLVQQRAHRILNRDRINTNARARIAANRDEQIAKRRAYRAAKKLAAAALKAALDAASGGA